MVSCISELRHVCFFLGEIIWRPVLDKINIIKSQVTVFSQCAFIRDPLCIFVITTQDFFKCVVNFC